MGFFEFRQKFCPLMCAFLALNDGCTIMFLSFYENCMSGENLDLAQNALEQSDAGIFKILIYQKTFEASW